MSINHGRTRVQQVSRGKSLQSTLRRLLWWCVAVLLWIVVVMLATYQPEILITNIETSLGSQVVDSTMRKEVDTLLDRRWMWLGRRDNRFLFGKKYAITQLKEQFPDIISIAMRYPDFHTLSIMITERTMAAQWCKESSNYKFNELCYAVDQFGVAYREAPYYSDDLIVKFYTDTLPEKENTPLSVLTPEEVSSFTVLKNALAEQGLHVRGAQFATTKEEGIALIIDRIAKSSLEQDMFIWMPYTLFATDSGHGKFVDIFSTLLREGPLASAVLAQQTGLEYIDLRFGNNVYYKFTNQDTVTLPTEKEYTE
ncbi:MAG: hypothetical protein ACI83D_000708 [Planctomycetota bacterium]|jgi:hypothetical protein